MDYTSWINAALGGLMIGVAAALLLLANGRIMGASGILGGLLTGIGGSIWMERAFFIAGLVGAPLIYSLITTPPSTNVTSNFALLIAGGLFVGVGTRMGSGCTSGHGVCGISRLSVRSLISTLVYIGAGVITVTLFRMMGAIL